MRRIICTALLLCAMLGMVIHGFAAEWVTYTPVTEGRWNPLSKTQESEWSETYESYFSFTPEETGTYVLYGDRIRFYFEEDIYGLYERVQFDAIAGVEYRFRAHGSKDTYPEGALTCCVEKAAPLESISLTRTFIYTDPDSTGLHVAGIECTPANGKLQDITCEISDDSVATVERIEGNYIYFKGRACGKATATVSTSTGQSAQCILRIDDYEDSQSSYVFAGKGQVLAGTATSYYGADGSVIFVNVEPTSEENGSCHVNGPLRITSDYSQAPTIRVNKPGNGEIILSLAVESAVNSLTVIEVLEDGSHRQISDTYFSETEMWGTELVVRVDRSMELIVVKKEQTFTDIQEDFWAKEAIDYMSARGYLQGKQDGSFAPGETIMRKTVAMLLYRLEGEPEVSGTAPFSDVKQDRYHNAILWASQTGIVNGYSDGTFRPDTTLSRQHFAAMLYRYAQLKEYVLDCTQGYPIFYYGDYSSVYSWARKACQWTSSTGVIAGRKAPVLAPEDAREEGWFDPQGATSRAQLAVIMQRFLEKAHDPEPEEADFGMATYIMTRDVGDCFPVNISHDGRVWDISWKSLDPTVATVDEIGVVTVIGEGVTVITVNDGEHFDSCAIQCGTPDSDDPKSILHDLPQEKKAMLSQAIAAEIAGVIQGETDLERVAKAATLINEQYVGWRFMDDQDPDYRNAYGLFVSGSANCVGTTKALGMILDCWGMEWEHVNPGEWDHQWCKIYDMDGQIGFGDGGVFGVAGYGDRETAEWYRWDDDRDMLREVMQRA